MTKEPDEDLIEATIRRVAEAKAERLGAVQADDGSDSAPSPEPVAAAEPAEPAVVPEVADADHDDDRIAATIRRVAEAKAARAMEARTPPGYEDATTPEPASPAITADPVQIRPPQPVDAPEPLAADGGWTAAVAELRRDLDATRRDLRALSMRFEAMLAHDAAALPAAVGASAVPEDDWDDTPVIPRMPIGQPPRPAIMRDPSPLTATAEHLQPEPQAETIIDTRPLPKPLPPLHAEPKRGLDLLPRTYRITVEDRRRGVDLVPLHRALLGMDGVRDMSLLSYSNGVAIVAVEMVDELDPAALEGAIARAMSHAAKVEVHNDTTMVVKLSEE